MKLDDDELLALLRRKEESASSYVHGALAQEREQGLREYYRMPYGNEEEGWSQIVSSDIQDTVEWIMPDLLDIFSSTDKAVEFEPTRADQVKGAEQATDTCNYVFHKQNNGFLILYTAIKDMLTVRNCAIHWRPQDIETVSSVPFKDATPEMLAVMLQPDDEIESAEQYPMMAPPQATPDGQQGQPMPIIDQMGMPVMLTKGRIKRVEKKRIVKVEAFSPNDLLVQRDWTSPLLHDCPYVAREFTDITLSDLRLMGFKDVTADELRGSGGDRSTRLESINRNGETFNSQDDAADDSMAEGRLLIEYVLADADGDGIAERLCVYRLDDKILKKEVVSHVPMATGSPVLNTHRWDGMSVADIMSDLQQAHTELLRQTFNNLYLTNNPRQGVLTDSIGTPYANIDDLLDGRAGGIVRHSREGAVTPLVTPFAAGASMPMMEYIRGMGESRMGVSRNSQGLDPDALNNTATGRKIDMTASQKRIKLIARIVAEVILKPVFAGILKVLTDGEMEKLAFRLRGEFVEVDPNEWRDHYDMAINVGLGSGDGEAQIAKLGMIYQAQMASMPLGLAHPSHIYHTQTKMVEAAGYKDVQNFFAEPQEGPMPPPQDPKAALEQAKMQADAQKFQAQTQIDQQKAMLEQQTKQRESQMQLELQASNDQRDSERQREQAAMQFQLEQLKLQHSSEIERMKNDTQKEIAAYDGQVKLQIAGLQQQAQRESQEFGARVEVDKMNMQAQHTTEAKKPDEGTSKALQTVLQEMASIKAHQTAPRKKVRDAAGKLVGVEINGQIVPITE